VFEDLSTAQSPAIVRRHVPVHADERPLRTFRHRQIPIRLVSCSGSWSRSASSRAGSARGPGHGDA